MIVENPSDPRSLYGDKANASVTVKKRKVMIAAVIFLATLAIAAAILSISRHHAKNEIFDFETILDVSDYAKDLDSSWSTSSENPSISEAKIESDRGFDGYSFVVYFHKTGENHITLYKGEEKYAFNVSVSEDKQVQIYPE